MRWGLTCLAVLLAGCGTFWPETPPLTAAERAGAVTYLARSLAPMPEGWRTGWMRARDGAILETGVLRAPGSKGTVVFVPGYTAPLEMYGHVYAALHDAGWSVAALAPRGQGRSVREGPHPEMGHLEDYDDLVDDLADFVARQAERPVHVVAVSMAGHVALRMAATRPVAVGRIAAVTPMVAVRYRPVPSGIVAGLSGGLSRVGLDATWVPGGRPWDNRRLFRDGDGRARHRTLCNADPDRANIRDALFALDPALRVTAPTYGWTARTEASSRWLSRPDSILRVRTPVLMITAGRDLVVDSRAASRFCATARNCREVRFPRARHCLLEGPPDQADMALEQVLTFLNAPDG